MHTSRLARILAASAAAITIGTTAAATVGSADSPAAVTTFDERAAPAAELPPAQPSVGIAELWPYGEFWNVPQLGREPVRGSGCGGSGQIGARIPDGLWAGYVSFAPDRDEVWFNLVCVYYGASAQAVLDQGTANVVLDDPGYLIVNNSDTYRYVPNNLQAVGISVRDDAGRCVPAGGMLTGADHIPAPDAHQYAPFQDDQAWVRIDDGAITWAMFGCDTGFQVGG